MEIIWRDWLGLRGGIQGKRHTVEENQRLIMTNIKFQYLSGGLTEVKPIVVPVKGFRLHLTVHLIGLTASMYKDVF